MIKLSDILDDEYYSAFKEMAKSHDLSEENMLRYCIRTTQFIDFEFDQGYDIQFINKETGEIKPDLIFGCMGDENE